MMARLRSHWPLFGFARALQDKTHVPVGLVYTAVLGTSISSWVPRVTVKKCTAYTDWRLQRAAIVDNPARKQALYEARQSAYEKQGAKAAVMGKPAPPKSLVLRLGSMGPDAPRRQSAFYNARVARSMSDPVAAILHAACRSLSLDQLAGRKRRPSL